MICLCVAATVAYTVAATVAYTVAATVAYTVAATSYIIISHAIGINRNFAKNEDLPETA